MRDKLKRGNGAAYVGAFLITFIMCCTMILVHNILVYQNALATQTAIDSISDSAALQDYLDRAEYEESLSNIQHMVDLIRIHLGIDVTDVTSDEEAFNRREVLVRGKTINPFFSPFLGSGSVDISRDATTKFARRSYGEDMISFMASIAQDDRFGYSMGSRDLRAGDMTDCSGLVYFAALCTGYPVGGDMFYSGDIAERLTSVGFERIPISAFNSISDFLPGDVLYYSAADWGSGYGHVETVYSTDPNNIQTVGAHGTYGSPETGDQCGSEISIRPATFEDLRFGRYVAVLRPTREANRLRNMDKNTWPTIAAQNMF